MLVLFSVWSMAATGSSTRRSEALTSQQRAALEFVRGRVGVYQHNSCHWRKLVGKSCVQSSDSAKRTRSVTYAQWVLRHWKNQARRDHNHARHWMAKRTNVLLVRGEQLRLELGKDVRPIRELAEAGNIESRFTRASRTVKQLNAEWKRSGFLDAFICIHRREGSWTSNTGNGYYGGLQEDKTFQRQYGPDFTAKWGTADHWPPWAQIAAGVRAVKGWNGPDPRTHAARGFHPWPKTAHDCGLI